MKNVCSVTFCGQAGIPQRCGHATCSECRLNMLKVHVENGRGCFKYACALCREEFELNPNSVIIALAKRRCSLQMDFYMRWEVIGANFPKLQDIKGQTFHNLHPFKIRFVVESKS